MTDREKELCEAYPEEIEMLLELLSNDEGDILVSELVDAASHLLNERQHAKEPELGATIFVPKNLSWQVHDEKLGGKTYTLIDHTWHDGKNWRATCDNGATWIEIDAYLARDLYNGFPISSFVYVFWRGEHQGIGY